MSTLIVGSAPDPSFPSHFKNVVYANGAIMHGHRLRSRGQGRHHHILSNSLLTGRNVYCTEALRCLEGQAVDRTVIMEFRAREAEVQTLDGIAYRTAECVRISRSEKATLERSAFGRSTLLALMKANVPLREKYPLLRKLLIKRELGLSTGLLALLYAVSEGLESPWIMCGIGLGSSGHSYNGLNATRGHVPNDKLALVHMMAGPLRRDVFSTASELCVVAGVPAWTGARL